MAENSVRGKRSNADQHDEDDAASLKPLRKIRAVSGYNLWHAGYMKTPEAKSLNTFAEKNHESARKWNLLSEEEKERFREKAASTEIDKKALNLKQQTTKILSHLQELTAHADNLPGFEFMFVAVYSGTHVVGGSTVGCKYLRESRFYIPQSFLGYVLANSVPISVDHSSSSKDVLRKEVENLFNQLYGAYVNKRTAKFPYSKITQYGITMEGLPSGVSLKHPSSYGKDALKEIISRKVQLKIQATSISSNHDASNTQLLPATVAMSSSGVGSRLPSATVAVCTSGMGSRLSLTTSNRLPSATVAVCSSGVGSRLPITTSSRLPSATVAVCTSGVGSRLPSATVAVCSSEVGRRLPAATVAVCTSGVGSQLPSATVAVCSSGVGSWLPSATVAVCSSGVDRHLPAATVAAVGRGSRVRLMKGNECVGNCNINRWRYTTWIHDS